MSGPIVRSGPSLQYSGNWDAIFGKKQTKKKKKTDSKAKVRKRKAKSAKKK